MADIFSFLSTGFIPLMAAIIVGHGIFCKAPIYDYFIEGARSGLKTAVEILPFLIGIFIAVNCLTSSGILNMINAVLSPVLGFLNVPAQLLPLVFLRAISGSGSLIILQDVLGTVGPDCSRPLFWSDPCKKNETRLERRSHWLHYRYRHIFRNMQVHMKYLSYARRISSV